MRDYYHFKFGLIWIKESKVTEGEGGGGGFCSQVENVLSRQGENASRSLRAAKCVHTIRMARWYVVEKECKFDNVEVKIITFVIKPDWKFTTTVYYQ